MSSSDLEMTVVVGAYNAERFLGATLETVNAQTLAPAEIIVVDDGLKDETAAVGRRHGARVITTPNRGVSAARNLAIQEAKTDWIALLDADDLWAANKLARQSEAARAAPDAQLVSCDHYQFEHDGPVVVPSLLGTRADRYAAVRPASIAPKVSRLSNMGIGLFTLGQAFFPSTLVFKRDLALRLGGFDVELRRSEDYEFLLRILNHSDVVVVDEPLMGYRVHPTGMSRDDRAMVRSYVQIADGMRRHPERYAPGALQAFQPLLRKSLLYAARLSIKKHDMEEARSMLKMAGAIHRDPEWLALSVASFLPKGAITTMHRLKQRLRA